MDKLSAAAPLASTRLTAVSSTSESEPRCRVMEFMDSVVLCTNRPTWVTHSSVASYVIRYNKKLLTFSCLKTLLIIVICQLPSSTTVSIRKDAFFGAMWHHSAGSTMALLKSFHRFYAIASQSLIICSELSKCSLQSLQTLDAVRPRL